ncbi:MAG TPA: 3-isopropylmalate dehydratase large subunit [Polyangia bacterium]
MGMTLSEKILARHAGRAAVAAGELVPCRVDFSFGSDLTVPPAAAAFRRMGGTALADPTRVALVQDHFQPAKDIASAELGREVRRFAAGQPGVNYYEVGQGGICHVVIPDDGLVVPGDLVVGADSHTCTYGALGCFATGVGATDLAAVWALGETWLRVPETVRVRFHGAPGPCTGGKDLALRLLKEIGVAGALYRALELSGAAVAALGMADRFTLCNMAIEAGAKAGLIAADEVTQAYLAGRARRPAVALAADPDAAVERTLDLDVAGLAPQVAAPFSPANVQDVDAVAGTPVDQVFIGSCTNGRIEDLRLAARVLGDRRVHPRTRLLVIPGSQAVLAQAVAEGLVARLLAAGATIGPPTCGPCLGGHLGVLAGGEVGLFTTNRNFVGRAGARDARVYLANPAVAAATAVCGAIADPREVAP